ncbi:hypothetical protein AMTR_s00117p00084010 [Amborella trichopoda]|uniref:Uncharacterized protein n=1 Tax=Amborella trichopoda TaxID=13333 RepID=W1NP13_AMBTC|nr:hypothetical protein AMTR_s00117p00084010 [Amborella trichopoda]
MRASESAPLIHPMIVDLVEGEREYPATFTIVGLVSSEDEATTYNIAMSLEKRLEAGMILDPKSREIASLREMVVRLRREVDHH